MNDNTERDNAIRYAVGKACKEVGIDGLKEAFGFRAQSARLRAIYLRAQRRRENEVSTHR